MSEERLTPRLMSAEELREWARIAAQSMEDIRQEHLTKDPRARIDDECAVATIEAILAAKCPRCQGSPYFRWCDACASTGLLIGGILGGERS